MTEEQIIKAMKSLDLSREEAIEMLADDEEVDRMTSTKEIDSDLTEEQKKVKKEATKTGSKKKTVYKFDKKTARKDEEKESFLEKLAEILPSLAQNVRITNKNREISFNLGENEYSLTLVKHRPPKK